jgi:hypothetical protein
VERRLVGLTGGRDSRTILAVILDEGLADEIEFQTLGAPDLPDVVVATRIASTFGLRHRNGSSHSGDEFRASRTAALRANGLQDLAYRELAMRLAVGMSCGMRNLAFPYRGHPAQGDQVLVSGYCGEGLRTAYPGASWVRTREHVQQFPLLGPKFGGLGILKPEAREHYDRQVQQIMMDGIEEHDDPRDIVDAWYLRTAFRRWIGPDQELNAENSVYPLYSVVGLRSAHAIGPDERRAERIPYEIIRRACSPLVDIPFQSGGWIERLTNGRPEPATRAPSAPTPTRLAPTRAVRSAARAIVGRLGLARRPSGVRSVRADQLRAYAAADAQIMGRYFRDASNPLFEIVDQRTVVDRVERLDQLPASSRRQLYGALTAAIWLGGHELTYPMSDGALISSSKPTRRSA